MNEEQLKKLIELTPEQNALLDLFLSAHEALENSGVRIIACEGCYYAINRNNLEDWFLDWADSITAQERAEDWSCLENWDTTLISRDIAYEATCDDVLICKVKGSNLDKNLFNN